MANFNINKSILGGRLTADPELKQTASGISACTFTIAVNRKYSKDGQQEADFITCQAWRQTAEFICRYFKKASAICVTGSIQTRSWTDNSGQKRFATDVVVDEAYFVDNKNDAEQPQTPPDPSKLKGTTAYTPTGYAGNTNPSFEEIPNDGQLPF